MEAFSKLQQAQEALTRFTADSQLARNTVADLKAQLNAAEFAVDEDGESAIIQGREPNRELTKQVAKITAALKAAEQNVRHHEGAISKQVRIISFIEERIYAHRHQAFEDAVSGDTKKLHRLVDELVATSLDIHAKAKAYGFADFDPFPATDREGSRAEIRSLQLGLYYAAQQLADTWARSYVDSPFEEPEVQQFPVPQVPRALDPLQVKISAEVEILCNLTERYRLAYIDLTEGERSIDRIRQPYYKIGGGFAPLSPADDKEMSRLRAIVAAKEAEIKTIQMDRQKTIESIAKLEREYSEKRTAATAVGMQA